MIYVLSLCGILGCVIGSFLGVVVARLPKKESIIRNRSHCAHCRRSISWYDLVPVLSYILLRGRCRYCHHKIGIQTFLIEIITGLLFVFVASKYIMLSTTIDTSGLVYSLYMLCSLIVIFFIDYNYSIIPDAIVYPAIIISLVYLLLASPLLLIPYFLIAMITFMFFFFLFVITKGRGMGFGDVKYSFLLALFLGFPNIIFALYVAFLTGALIAFILILARKRKFYGGTIPFGPFLSFGGIVSFFYGTLIEKIFQHMFF